MYLLLRGNKLLQDDIQLYILWKPTIILTRNHIYIFFQFLGLNSWIEPCI